MPQNNAINNRSSTLTVDNALTVTAGGASITGNSTINGGTVGIGTDNASNGITIGTGTTGRLINIGLSAAGHTIVIGNTNTTTSMSLQSGSGNTVVNSSGTSTVTGTGGVSINSLSGAINVGDGANANAINIGTGAAARTITLGNTTGATALNLDIGTGDFTLDSATGTIISALDTGEVSLPLQPAFFAYNSATDADVTGDGTVYQIIFDTELYDIGNNYDNTTGVFTAPVDGIYQFTGTATLTDIGAGHTRMDFQFNVNSGTTVYRIETGSPAAVSSSTNVVAYNCSQNIQLSAGDTMALEVIIFNSTLTVDVNGGSGRNTWFSGVKVA